VAIFPPLAGGSCSQSGRPAMPHPAGGRTPRALPGASPAARRVRP
jgi:hypothetical protein